MADTDRFCPVHGKPRKLSPEVLAFLRRGAEDRSRRLASRDSDACYVCLDEDTTDDRMMNTLGCAHRVHRKCYTRCVIDSDSERGGWGWCFVCNERKF